MIKVAMIGAGSVVFARNLTGDILSYPEFQDATIHYMDIDEERLAVAGRLGQKIADKLGVPATIKTTTDRREAVKDADFVINMVQIGGFDSTLVDFEIPRKFGLNFTIADTTGPGALFRALRTYPLMHGLCKDMEQLCPRGVLLNYSNPMSMNMQTVFRTSSIQAVGLCHSVQGTLDQLMRYIDVDSSKVSFICAGINHMAFYTKLELDGEDLYPRLFKAMEDPKVYNTNKVRFELMRRFGYYITESSEHNAEYCPYFIPHGKEEIEKYNVPIDEYLQRCDGGIHEYERLVDFAHSDAPMNEVRKSHEYGSTIIHAISTGTPAVVYGNLPNNGAISNLPDSAIVEGPTLVDRAGLQLTRLGELPPQLVGYMNPHVTQHELFIRAAMEGRIDHVYQACMFDPLTAATVTPDKIVEMCDELVVAHGADLPKLEKTSLVPTSGKTFNPPTAKELRASWDAAKAASERDIVKEWHVLGPIPTEAAGLDVETEIEAQLHNGLDVDKSITLSNGTELHWRKARSNRHGHVNLHPLIGNADDDKAVAYAVHEFEEVHDRDARIGAESNSGIRLWLDGKVMVEATDGSAKTEFTINAGSHRILAKVAAKPHWNFGATFPPANF
ncbi:MAG: alpha-glucosidase/alpha-galactosidase [Planctomycetota bacterium]|jgi:alpha-galactosidase|nr:alpha-glucosidase/alpha-galactosidase [Planctomycetota bacterium]